jgi:glyoxylase-like metal-dependent hydrolase (beta-lactamase superfamily II)
VSGEPRPRALRLDSSPFALGREILPGVHRVRVTGSSVFLLEGPRVTLVDSGPRGSGARILRYLRHIGRSPRELDTIVLTHYHPDHAGGAAELLELTDARLAAHMVEAPYLRGDLAMPNPIRHQALAAAAKPLLPWLMPQPMPVDLPLHDGDELPALGGLRVVHTPGHTPGSICLSSRRRGLLLVGDALQWKRGQLCPPSRHFSEDLELAMRSIRRLADMDVGTLCFSHFPPAANGDTHLRALVAS